MSLMEARQANALMLEQMGYRPQNTFHLTTNAAAYHERYAALEAGTVLGAEKVSWAGRITNSRNDGMFLDIEDRTGKIQVFTLKSSPLFPVMRYFDLGDFIGVRGHVKKTNRGELSIAAEEVVLLAKSYLPPPDRHCGLVDGETRFRKRYLDMMSNGDVRSYIMGRAQCLAAIRSILDQDGFIEVETPILHDIASGAAAKPFDTHHNAMGMDLHLRISPELYLKRLLVGGMERVYEIGRSFRNEGISHRHNPEFTMLEAYGAYMDVTHMMDYARRIVKEWLSIDEIHTASMRDLILQYTGQDILLYEGEDFGSYVLDLFEREVEGQLTYPVFVTGHPASISPLAKHDGRFAERFELYIGGIEVANGYTEENNPFRQRDNFLAQKGDDKVEIDNEYVEALMHGMPPAGGIGIGIDRLLMLRYQVPIKEVIAFPLMRSRNSE